MTGCVILTGGPGAGKTSVINWLAQQGWLTFEEASRYLIIEQSQHDNGILPWTDLPRFADLCFTMMSEQKRAAKQQPWAFCDRAMGDICAYLALGNQAISAELKLACSGYYPQVFVFTPKQEIYQQDSERPHTFAEAMVIHQQLVATYQQLGYQVVEVPWGEIKKRAEWILARLGLESLK
ncbi:TPA: AAA family ATPase [Photobacterium damselae]